MILIRVLNGISSRVLSTWGQRYFAASVTKHKVSCYADYIFGNRRPFNYEVELRQVCYATTSSEDTTACWKCGKQVNKSVFCKHCSSLQQLSKHINYFQVLGIEEKFSIDEAALSTVYKNLQKQLHPDKFSAKEKIEQDMSAEYSSIINKAYSTLSQPLSRGLYLLKMKGIVVSDKTQPGNQFLHEIMELNEEVENAESEEEVMRLYNDIKGVLRRSAQELGEAFHRNDIGQAEQIAIRMQYYTSIEGQLKETIRKMGLIQ